MRLRLRPVGRTTDGNLVIGGREVFRMVDTLGLPLEIIRLELGSVVYDVREFIEAAAASGNYAPARLLRLLVGEGALPREQCEREISAAYGANEG